MSLLADYARKLFAGRTKSKTEFNIKNYTPLQAVVERLGVRELGFYQALDFYGRVSILSTCVDLISETFSRLDVQIVDAADNIRENTALEQLLDQPNKDMGWSTFAQTMATYFLVTGNVFIIATGNPAFAPNQLILIKPTDVSVNGDGFTINNYGSFKRDANGRFISNTGMSELFHFKRFTPDLKTTDDIVLGQSKLQAIYTELDLFEAGYLFNKSMLKNGARPSGIVIAGNQMTDGQYEQIRSELNSAYGGSANAGKIMFFDGMGEGSTFQTLSMTANDMQFADLSSNCVNRICNRLGVPLPLVVPDASTYNNVSSSILFLYDNTIFPLADLLFGELTRVLVPRYPDLQMVGAEISYDQEDIGAIKERTVDSVVKKVNTGLFTTNELRREAGYEDIEGGDMLTGSAPVRGQYDVFQGILNDAKIHEAAED